MGWQLSKYAVISEIAGKRLAIDVIHEDLASPENSRQIMILEDKPGVGWSTIGGGQGIAIVNEKNVSPYSRLKDYVEDVLKMLNDELRNKFQVASPGSTNADELWETVALRLKNNVTWVVDEDGVPQLRWSA